MTQTLVMGSKLNEFIKKSQMSMHRMSCKALESRSLIALN